MHGNKKKLWKKNEKVNQHGIKYYSLNLIKTSVLIFDIRDFEIDRSNVRLVHSMDPLDFKCSPTPQNYWPWCHLVFYMEKVFNLLLTLIWSGQLSNIILFVTFIYNCRKVWTEKIMFVSISIFFIWTTRHAERRKISKTLCTKILSTSRLIWMIKKK